MEEVWGVQICGLPSPLSAFCSLTDLNPFTPTTNQLTYLLSPFFWEIFEFLFISFALCLLSSLSLSILFFFLSYLPVFFLFSFPKVCPLSLNRSWLLSLDLVANCVANCPIPHHHLLTSFLPSFSKFPRFLSSLSLSVVCLMLPCQPSCTLCLVPLHLPFITYSLSSPFLEQLHIGTKSGFQCIVNPTLFLIPPLQLLLDPR